MRDDSSKLSIETELKSGDWLMGHRQQGQNGQDEFHGEWSLLLVFHRNEETERVVDLNVVRWWPEICLFANWRIIFGWSSRRRENAAASSRLSVLRLSPGALQKLTRVNPRTASKKRVYDSHIACTAVMTTQRMTAFWASRCALFFVSEGERAHLDLVQKVSSTP